MSSIIREVCYYVIPDGKCCVVVEQILDTFTYCNDSFMTSPAAGALVVEKNGLDIYLYMNKKKEANLLLATCCKPNKMLTQLTNVASASPIPMACNGLLGNEKIYKTGNGAKLPAFPHKGQSGVLHFNAEEKFIVHV